MLNYIWLGLILCSVIVGGLTHRLDDIGQEAIKGAKEAVEIVLKLIGTMALWLGLMRIAEKAGFVQLLARALRPVMRWLFPDVPAEHPAMGAMVMNMAANMLGIGNAATPLGLKAMRHLQRINPLPHTASNAMCTFLAINTSSIQLIPANQIAMLAAAGAIRPTSIIGTALVATTFSTIAGIAAVKLLARMPWWRLPASAAEPVPADEVTDPDDTVVAAEPAKPIGTFGKVAIAAFVVFFAWLFYQVAFPANRLHPGEARVVLCENGVSGHVVEGKIARETGDLIAIRTLYEDETTEIAKAHPAGCPKSSKAAPTGTKAAPHVDRIQRYESGGIRAVDTLSILAIPFLLAFFPLYGLLRGLKVYDEFVVGAKEGFTVAVSIIPHVVAMLAAVYMFRAAGCIDAITTALRPVLGAIGFPPELVPLSLMRPISGGGTTGLFVELIKTFGPDHLITRTAGTIIGSTETTLYVIAVYFGSVAIRRTRHAIPAGLIADVVGMVAAVIVCRMVFA